MCKQKIKQAIIASALGLTVLLNSAVYAIDNNIKEMVSENFVATTIFNNDLFVDITGEEWFVKGVSSTIGYGLMVGESKDKFNPNGNITVAQSIAVASRVHSLYNTGSLDALSKYGEGSKWYDGVVKYAIEEGIIKAKDFSSGDMNKPATRGELCYILYGSIPESELGSINEIKMDDVKDVNSRTKFADSILKSINSGIITGYEDDTIKPNNKITRAEASCIIDRIVRPSERIKQTAKPETPQTNGGNVVYVSPRSSYGTQSVYDKPSSGLTPINVKYGKHVYLSNNQKEYDYVIGVVEDMLQFKGRAGKEYKAEIDKWNSDSKYRARMMYSYEGLNISDEKEAFKIFKIERACQAARTHGGSSAKEGINSAYELLTTGKGDCTASAMLNMAVMDAMGYNAKTVANDAQRHEWVMLQIDGRWHHLYGGGIEKENVHTYNKVTTPDTFNHQK